MKLQSNKRYLSTFSEQLFQVIEDMDDSEISEVLKFAKAHHRQTEMARRREADLEKLFDLTIGLGAELIINKVKEFEETMMKNDLESLVLEELSDEEFVDE